MPVRRRRLFYTAMVLVMVIGVSGCAKKKAVPAPPPPAPAPAPPRPLTEEEVFGRKTVDDLNREMPLAEVHFDYDQATIRDQDRGILQKNADYLRRWMSVRVTVEGHADARGTNEYNLALGDRRANAVKMYLAGLGIAGDRLTVVSKGEEDQLCGEMTDDCYARNRRGHFVITAK